VGSVHRTIPDMLRHPGKLGMGQNLYTKPPVVAADCWVMSNIYEYLEGTLYYAYIYKYHIIYIYIYIILTHAIAMI